MAKRYDEDYKVQSVKLATEIGINKAAREIGVATSTLNGWVKASREGRLDLGEGSYSPDHALTITEEISILRKQLS